MRFLAVAFWIMGYTVCIAAEQTAPPPPHNSYSHATANYAGAGKPGEWTSQARDYANTRYSPLDQINADQCRQP